MAEREGFEPSIRNSPYTRFPGVRLKPLGHLSVTFQTFACLNRCTMQLQSRRSGDGIWVRSRHHCSNLLAHSSSIVTIWCRLRPVRRCGVCLTSPCHCRRFQPLVHLVIRCFSLSVFQRFGHPVFQSLGNLVIRCFSLRSSGASAFWSSRYPVLQLSVIRLTGFPAFRCFSLLVLQPSGHLVIRCFTLPVFQPSVLPASRRFSLLAPCLSVIRPSIALCRFDPVFPTPKVLLVSARSCFLSGA